MTRALFVLAATLCALVGGWLAVAVLAGWRVALRWFRSSPAEPVPAATLSLGWNPQEVVR